MLELLAGPFEVRDEDGTSRSTSPSLGQGFWSDIMGFVFVSGTYGNWVAQMDGRAYPHGNLGSSGSINWGVPDLTRRDGFLAHDSLNSDLYELEMRSLTYGTTVHDGTAINEASVGARIPGGYLRVASSQVQFTASLPASWTDVIAAPISSGRYYSHGRNLNELCVVSSAGRLVFYNWMDQTIDPVVRWLPANTGAWYSPKFNVFITHHTVSGVSTLRVYANAPRPNALSVPTALDTIQAGRASRVQVRLLGSNSEPCPDEIIEWGLTGVGELSAEQSTTDEDGYAEIRYIAPVTAGGGVTITAQVQY